MEMDFEKDLRWLLGSFLFAVVIAEVLLQSAKLYDRRHLRKGFSPFIIHLIVATLLVTTSWVGWTSAISKEQAPAHHLTSVFSWAYLLLLVDIWLLVCYFIFIKAAEIPHSATESLTTPSPRSASFWLMIIFLTYVGWDGINFWVLHRLAVFWAAGWPTVLCFVIAFITWLLATRIETKMGFILVEILIFLLIVLFRGLKWFVKDDLAALLQQSTQ
jgi:hypothetical protein